MKTLVCFLLLSSTCFAQCANGVCTTRTVQRQVVNSNVVAVPRPLRWLRNRRQSSVSLVVSSGSIEASCGQELSIEAVPVPTVIR
jgi:hypothetical protein